MSASEQFATLKRANVVRSTTNPRTIFNPTKLQELADSIKAAGGVLQPLLVRPLPAWRVPETPRNVTHEIVCGERRDRGCEIAGIAEYPVMIRDLSDDQVREIQLVENLQRDDLTALEEAEGYHQLMEHSKISAEQVGEKIGKSRTYVFNRLKLLDLGTEGRTALRDGKIDYSVAMLIARIPDGKLQVKALKEVVDGMGYHKEPMSFRRAQEHVQSNYMLKLSDARFKITVAELVPGVGSCKDCSKRTGANPDLFSDVKSADVCTDPPCFHKKEEAAAKLMVKEAEAKGQTVIAGKEAEELRLGYGANARFKGYKRLDDKEDSPTGEPLRKIIAKAMAEKGIKPTMLEHPTKKGQLVACLPNDVANSLLKTVQDQAKADKKAAPAAIRDLLDEKANQEKVRLDAKFDREVRAEVIATTWAEILQAPRKPATMLGHFSLEVHRYLADRAVWNLDADATEAVCKLLDLGAVGGRHALEKHVEKASDPDRLHLLCLLHARTGAGFDLVTKTVWGDRLKPAVKAIEAEVRERVYPKPAKKAPSTDAPAAQATGVRGKAGAKANPAAAAKTSAEEAKQGIADALRGLEGSASEPKGSVAPSAAPGALAPQTAWPFPTAEKLTPAQKAGNKNATDADQEAPADPLVAKARALVLKQQEASVRLLKEELGIGTTKAMDIMSSLEAAGVIGPAIPRQPREVLLDKKGNARGAE